MNVKIFFAKVPGRCRGPRPESTQVRAARADSCMTSPSFPVSVTSPLPLTSVASTCRTSPPTSVQARPLTRPISLFRAISCLRNRIVPSSSCTFPHQRQPENHSCPRMTTNLRAIFRRHEPISRSRFRTPASRYNDESSRECHRP